MTPRAERCKILTMRTRAADDWTEATTEWLEWATGLLPHVRGPEELRALGELIEALGSRMQRSTRNSEPELDTFA